MALAPGLARKVKKVLETRVDDPEIVPILERGMRYIDEFAQPVDPKKSGAKS